MYAADRSSVTASSFSRATLFSQLFEEGAERGGVLALASPHDGAALVVDYDCHVLVVPPVAQLVDADEAQTVERLVGSKPRHHTLMMLPTVAQPMRIMSLSVVLSARCAR